MGGLLVSDSSVSTCLGFLEIHFVEKTTLRVILLLDNRTGLKLNDTFHVIRAMTDVCCYQAAASGKAGEPDKGQTSFRLFSLSDMFGSGPI